MEDMQHALQSSEMKAVHGENGVENIPYNMKTAAVPHALSSF